MAQVAPHRSEYPTSGNAQGSVADLALGIASWLRSNQQPDGRIRDPLHGDCGTYAGGMAALAFGLAFIHTGEASWAEACRLSARAARQRPLSSEFDQLALLLLALEERKAGMTIAGNEPVALYLGRRLVSNNWVAMRALNYSLRAHLTGSKSDTREADRLWEKVLSWQTADGLFIDSPGGEATPVTYHAKFCAMLALAWTETGRDSSAMAHALRHGLDALYHLVSPSGMLVPYGRSRNTLFGYAAALLALRRGATLFQETRYAAASTLLEARLTRFQRPDGHIPCVLNDGEAEKADWDVYVNNPDYNAYAAALLLLAGDAVPAGPDPTDSGAVPRVQRVGPLLTIRAGGLFAAVAAEGQAVPLGTPFFCDHRYYALQPLWIERDGAVLLEPAPYCWKGGEDRSALVDPRANPWVPYVEWRGERYALRCCERVSVRQEGGILEMVGEGLLAAYRPVPRWERGLRQVLLGRAGRPQPVFRAAVLPGVRLRRWLVLDCATGQIRAGAECLDALPSGALLRQKEPGV